MIFFYFFYFLFSIISNFENALIRFNVRFIFQSNYIFHIMVECIKQILDNSKLYLNVPVNYCHAWCKVGKILKVAWISSPSLKIQIMGGKVYLSCKCKTLLGFVNKLLKAKCLLRLPSNILPYYLNFPTDNLNFHWRWSWWDWIQSIFLNLFYFSMLQFGYINGLRNVAVSESDVVIPSIAFKGSRSKMLKTTFLMQIITLNNIKSNSKV